MLRKTTIHGRVMYVTSSRDKAHSRDYEATLIKGRTVNGRRGQGNGSREGQETARQKAEREAEVNIGREEKGNTHVKMYEKNLSDRNPSQRSTHGHAQHIDALLRDRF